MSNATIRQEITNKLLASMVKGTLPWRRKFSLDENSGPATSLSTGKTYNGINQLLLQLAAFEKNFQSKWWGSYNAIRYSGGCVKKGERSTSIYLFNPVEKTRYDKNGDKKVDTFLIYRRFAVFNAEQCNGLDGYQVGVAKSNKGFVERCAEAEKIIEATAADIEFGTNKPCYQQLADKILMPHRHQFDSAEAFYEVMFHELGHMSHHPSRMNPAQKPDPENYAFFELVAEISACYLMNECKLEIDDSNHAAYLQSWLSGLRNDTRFIFEASSLASKTADYILSFSRKGTTAIVADREEIPF